jgi:hypothetical protein
MSKPGLHIGGGPSPGSETSLPKLEIVDATTCSDDVRQRLKPWSLLTTREGHAHRLPRFFYKVPDWDTAKNGRITPHFDLWEFLETDVREDRLLHEWPRYLPCAITLLAAQLQLFRDEIRSYVHISANGGYRSPAHKLSTHASTHCWGTAANIHRIGDELLDNPRSIARYSEIARDVMPGAYVRPYGHNVGEADDHLHIDLGYVEVIPYNVSEEVSRS